MDFNTGSGGGLGSGSGTGGPIGGPSPRVSGGTGAEFELSDPVASFVRTIRELISRPTAFFRAMPKSGSLINPVAFAAICAAIAALPAALLFLVFGVLASASAGDATSVFGGVIFAIFLIILLPIGIVVNLFVSAAIYHVLVLVWARRGHAGFGSTLRAVSYAWFPPFITSFLAFIPFLNILWGLAVGIYALILLVLGIREAHTTTTGTALLVVFTLPAIGLILSIVFGLIGVLAVSLGQ